MEKALAEGEALVNDMSESQLLTLIKEKNWSAISFWLRHRNPKFKDKVEITSRVEDSGELTPSQAAVVRKALQLAELLPKANSDNHDKSDKSDSPEPLRSNVEGQTGKGGDH